MKLLQKIFLISSKFLEEVNTQHFLKFLYNLECQLLKKYEQHWYPKDPIRGNGYRSLQVDSCQIDPLLIKAAKQTNAEYILSYLPSEFTIWIDPRQVSYRFKEFGDIMSYFKIENNPSSNRVLWPYSDVLLLFMEGCKRTQKQKTNLRSISENKLYNSQLIIPR